MATRIITNVEAYKTVVPLIMENGGHCPCAIVKSKDTKCMCKDFREQEEGDCHCGLYTKVKYEGE